VAAGAAGKGVGAARKGVGPAAKSGATGRPAVAARTGSKAPVTSRVSEPELDEDLDEELNDDVEVDAKDEDDDEGYEAPARKAPARTTSRPGARPATKAGSSFGRSSGGSGKGRRPVAPVRVNQRRNWGPIILYVLTGLIALGLLGWASYPAIHKALQKPWQQQAAAIPGIHNYLQSNPEWFVVDPNVGNHQSGKLTYPIYPPVGGTHNPQWQDCMGDVYTSQIANEQAVHSMEHGAVWITYRPDLPQDQIDKLASRVRNVPFMLMSPYPNLDAPISLQAWGYQLKVDNASDGRIDSFIKALRVNTTREPQAGCSGGITDATVDPLDLPGTGM
jgi:hypothetical protein